MGLYISSSQGHSLLNYLIMTSPLLFLFSQNSQNLQAKSPGTVSVSHLSPHNLHLCIFVTCFEIFHLFNFLDLFWGGQQYPSSPLLYVWKFLALISHFLVQGNLLCLTFTNIFPRLSFSQRVICFLQQVSPALWFVCILLASKAEKFNPPLVFQRAGETQQSH